MAGLLGTALSGLMAFQRALDTTSHNIANVNTDGYSRQHVELGARLPEHTGAGYIGQGVDVTAVSRSYDQFVASQLTSSSL
jgi:flagellar hook-associated protein 1 FlgK